MLHIWSLSVEEQYYFVFPILLLLVVRRAWRTQIVFVLLLMLLSLGAAYLPAGGLDKYYLPHLRAFEMLIGSLTAIVLQQQIAVRGEPAGRAWAGPVSVSALLVLLACFWLYYPNMPHFPGWAGLLPCAATALLIYFNGFEHRWRCLFEWRPLVAVGLISYSLYLWHWPVLAFARYVHGTEQLPSAWLLPLVLLMVVAALLSYRFLEQPLKKWQPAFSQSLLRCYVLPLCAVAAAVVCLQYSPLIRGYQQQGLARGHTSCHNNLSKQCVWGSSGQQPTVLMLGDSHADHFKTFIDVAGKQEGWSARLISADTCAFVDDYDSALLRNSSSCRAVHRYAAAHMADYPVVVLAMRWGNQIAVERRSQAYDPDFFDKLDKTVAALSQSKQAVYLFSDTPNIDYPGLRAHKLQQWLPLKAVVPKPADNRATEEGNRKMAEVAARYPNVYVVDVNPLLPDNFQFDGKPIYADLDHISPWGGEQLARRYLQRQPLLTAH